MKRLLLLLGVALCVGCQGGVLDQGVPTPVPALVESPLGKILSFTAQVSNWTGKTAEVRLDAKPIGTVDASGKMTVFSDFPLSSLSAAGAALLPLPPLAEQSAQCSLDEVTMSDPQAQVTVVEQLVLREVQVSGQLHPLLSPPMPLPMVTRKENSQSSSTVTALVYADRDVLIKGQRTCRGTLWPWEQNGPPFQQAAAIHVQLRQGWNEVRFSSTYSEVNLGGIGGGKTEYRSTLTVSGESMPLPWKYNGVQLTYPVP